VTSEPLFESVQPGAVGAALFTGPLERDSFGNYHCGEYVIAPEKVEGKFAIGDEVVITKWGVNKHPLSVKRYPKYAMFLSRV
jgi:hypothetical protein